MFNIFLTLNKFYCHQLFSFLGAFSSLIRHHLNPRILLLESEQRKDYFKKNLGIQDRKKWKKKSLLYHIVAVGGDKARSFWTWTYLLFVLFSIGEPHAFNISSLHETTKFAALNTHFTLIIDSDCDHCCKLQ